MAISLILKENSSLGRAVTSSTSCARRYDAWGTKRLRRTFLLRSTRICLAPNPRVTISALWSMSSTLSSSSEREAYSRGVCTCRSHTSHSSKPLSRPSLPALNRRSDDQLMSGTTSMEPGRGWNQVLLPYDWLVKELETLLGWLGATRWSRSSSSWFGGALRACPVLPRHCRERCERGSPNSFPRRVMRRCCALR